MLLRQEVNGRTGHTTQRRGRAKCKKINSRSRVTRPLHGRCGPRAPGSEGPPRPEGDPPPTRPPEARVGHFRGHHELAGHEVRTHPPRAPTRHGQRTAKAARRPNVSWGASSPSFACAKSSPRGRAGCPAGARLVASRGPRHCGGRNHRSWRAALHPQRHTRASDARRLTSPPAV